MANEQLENLKSQTKQGWETAIKEHRTMNLKMDVDAPVIVFPEDARNMNSEALLLDLGHLSIASKVVDKEKKLAIQSTFHSSDASGHSGLEDLMFDNFDIALKNLQLLIGPAQDIIHCDKKLVTSPYHVVNQINVQMKAKYCILPHAEDYTRLKLDGSLPDLTLNFSDRKYSGMMRVAQRLTGPPPPHVHSDDMPSPLSRPTFGEDVSLSKDRDSSLALHSPEHSGAAQKLVDLTFRLDKVNVICRQNEAGKSSSVSATERSLFEVNVIDVDCTYIQRLNDFAAAVEVEALAILDHIQKHGESFKYLLRTVTENNQSSSDHQKLASFKYSQGSAHNAKPANNTDVPVRTLEARFGRAHANVNKESVLIILDFLQNTFTTPSASAKTEATEIFTELESTKVHLFMDSLSFALNSQRNTHGYGTLKGLHTDILLRSDTTMLVNGKLGDVSFSKRTDGTIKDFDRILSIESEELLDFTFETYKPKPKQIYNSALRLQAGSLRLYYDPSFLSQTMAFLSSFFEMKNLLDSARNVFGETVTSTDPTGIKLDVMIKTPIFVVPRDVRVTTQREPADAMVSYLGEMSISNSAQEKTGSLLDDYDIEFRNARISSSMICNDKRLEQEIAKISINLRASRDLTKLPQPVLAVHCF